LQHLPTDTPWLHGDEPPQIPAFNFDANPNPDPAIHFDANWIRIRNTAGNIIIPYAFRNIGQQKDFAAIM
jgi:hypothetical protein